MKRTIARSNVVCIAQQMHKTYASIMHPKTMPRWQDTLAFAARELKFYNDHGGYGCVADTFLIAVHQLGLDK